MEKKGLGGQVALPQTGQFVVVLSQLVDRGDQLRGAGGNVGQGRGFGARGLAPALWAVVGVDVVFVVQAHGEHQLDVLLRDAVRRQRSTGLCNAIRRSSTRATRMMLTFHAAHQLTVYQLGQATKIK